MLGVLEDWLRGRGLPHRLLRDDSGSAVGLLVEIAGGRPGPWWALDACVDTAGFGDEAAWTFPPTCGDVVDGWLRGRGAADSKLAAAMFCHLAADFAARAEDLRGGLALLLDVDEHTGAFGGARAYLADPAAVRPAGMMIGYPGLDAVVVGGRGLHRATLTVHGFPGHSGARTPSLSAITRAARLVRLLDEAELTPDTGSVVPVGPVVAGDLADAADPSFPLPPKLTVTSIHGGEGFSANPDRCDLNVDIRTTPAFDAHAAEHLLRRTAAALDTALPGPRPTALTPVATWPPFRLGPDQQPAAALLAAATAAGLPVRPKTAGPSNIGNLLAAHGIPATAGFGVPHHGLHAPDERAHLPSLPTVHTTYHQALTTLLDLR